MHRDSRSTYTCAAEAAYASNREMLIGRAAVGRRCLIYFITQRAWPQATLHPREAVVALLRLPGAHAVA